MRMLAALKITPGEFFGSVIPLAFSEPLHAELHEKLQDILESATEAVGGIKVNIEWIHSELVRRKAKPVRKTERPPSRKELARHMMGS